MDRSVTPWQCLQSVVHSLPVVHMECSTAPNVHPTPTCITACNEFYPAFPHVNTARQLVTNAGVGMRPVFCHKIQNLHGKKIIITKKIKTFALIVACTFSNNYIACCQILPNFDSHAHTTHTPHAHTQHTTHTHTLHVHMIVCRNISEEVHRYPDFHS